MDRIQKPTTNKTQVVYGLRPVMEAIGSGQQIERVLIQNGLNSSLLGELRTLMREHDLPFQYVPVEKLNKMTAGNHQGVVAVIAAVKYHSFMDLVETLGEKALVVLLDHITDVRNMGAIARTAECTGVSAIVVPDHGSAALNEDAVKTSSGALLRLPVCREQNLKTSISPSSMGSRSSPPPKKVRCTIARWTLPSQRFSSWATKRLASVRSC